MVARELRDMWWKVLLLAPFVVLSVLELPAYESSERIREMFSAEVAVNQVWSMYTGGALWALGLLAVLLGAVLISSETNRGTIFFLLSRPVSRNRILITKYALSAGVLLIVGILGHVAVFAFAVFARGYPPGLFDAAGMALSSVLIWLVSLVVLGLATISSILFRNPLVSLAATFGTIFTLVMAFILTLSYVGPRLSDDTWDTLSRFGERVWSLVEFASWDLYNGETLALTSFLAWTAFAAFMLAVALGLFRRKSY